MKRIMCLLLSMIVVICVVGCSAKSVPDDTNTDSQQVTVIVPGVVKEPEESMDDQKITFDNILVFENDRITIHLMEAYLQHKNYSNKPEYDALMFTLQITNKSSKDIMMNIGDVYIGSLEAERMMEDGSVSLKPGKGGIYRYSVNKGTFDNPISITDANDVYELEVYFDLYDDLGNQLSNEEEVSFKVSDHVTK